MKALSMVILEIPILLLPSIQPQATLYSIRTTLHLRLTARTTLRVVVTLHIFLNSKTATGAFSCLKTLLE